MWPADITLACISLKVIGSDVAVEGCQQIKFRGQWVERKRDCLSGVLENYRWAGVILRHKQEGNCDTMWVMWAGRCERGENQQLRFHKRERDRVMKPIREQQRQVLCMRRGGQDGAAVSSAHNISSKTNMMDWIEGEEFTIEDHSRLPPTSHVGLFNSNQCLVDGCSVCLYITDGWTVLGSKRTEKGLGSQKCRHKMK